MKWNRIVARRDVLRLGGAAALLGGCAAPAAAQRQGYIDSRVHVWTPEVDRDPLFPSDRRWLLRGAAERALFAK